MTFITENYIDISGLVPSQNTIKTNTDIPNSLGTSEKNDNNN